jgi:thiamine kinase-like enzyme
LDRKQQDQDGQAASQESRGEEQKEQPGPDNDSRPPFLDTAHDEPEVQFFQLAELHTQAVRQQIALSLQALDSEDLREDHQSGSGSCVEDWIRQEELCKDLSAQVQVAAVHLLHRYQQTEKQLESFARRACATLLQLVATAKESLGAQVASDQKALLPIKDLAEELGRVEKARAAYYDGERKGLAERYENLQERKLDLQDEIIEIEFKLKKANNRKNNQEKVAQLNDDLKQAEKAALHFNNAPETRLVYDQLRKFTADLPEIAFAFPDLHPLFGTPAQQMPIHTLEVDFEDVEKLDTAAAGRHDLLLATVKGSQQRRVLKMYTESSGGTTQSRLKDFKKAISVMGTLPHPNIIQLLGVATDQQGNWFIEMPHYKCDLRVWMEEQALSTLPPAERSARALPVAVAILQGLAFLHSHQVVHNDFKPENIVLDPDGAPVIVDFDTSKVCSIATSTGVITGTAGYVHPDVLHGSAAPSPESDMFAFGVVLGELLGKGEESACHLNHQASKQNKIQKQSGKKNNNQTKRRKRCSCSALFLISRCFMLC